MTTKITFEMLNELLKEKAQKYVDMGLNVKYVSGFSSPEERYAEVPVATLRNLLNIGMINEMDLQLLLNNADKTSKKLDLLKAMNKIFGVNMEQKEEVKTEEKCTQETCKCNESEKEQCEKQKEDYEQYQSPFKVLMKDFDKTVSTLLKESKDPVGILLKTLDDVFENKGMKEKVEQMKDRGEKIVQTAKDLKEKLNSTDCFTHVKNFNFNEKERTEDEEVFDEMAEELFTYFTHFEDWKVEIQSGLKIESYVHKNTNLEIDYVLTDEKQPKIILTSVANQLTITPNAKYFKQLSNLLFELRQKTVEGKISTKAKSFLDSLKK